MSFYVILTVYLQQLSAVEIMGLAPSPDANKNFLLSSIDQDKLFDA